VWLSGSALVSIKINEATLRWPVVGDHLQMGKSLWYVTSHPGHPSLQEPLVDENNFQFPLLLKHCWLGCWNFQLIKMNH